MHRRQLLASLGAALVASVFAGCDDAAEGPADTDADAARADFHRPDFGPRDAAPDVGADERTDALPLAALRRDRAEAAEVGRAWLDTRPAEATVAALTAALLGETPPDLQDAEALRAHFTARHRADLADGDLTEVEGWQLSTAEVHLYALVALLDA
jgi:hypothetical protein